MKTYEEIYAIYCGRVFSIRIDNTGRHTVGLYGRETGTRIGADTIQEIFNAIDVFFDDLIDDDDEENTN